MKLLDEKLAYARVRQHEPRLTFQADLRDSPTRLHLAMLIADVTIDELAARVSFSRQFLNRLLSGHTDIRNIKVRLLVDLSRALGVTLDFLSGANLPAVECERTSPQITALNGLCAEANRE